MFKKQVFAVALSLIALTAAFAQSDKVEEKRGKVVKVTSGDTFMLEDSTWVRLVGIQDIEVPIQWDQDGKYPWTVAKSHLSSLILGKEVRLVDVVSHPRWLVASVYLDTLDVNLYPDTLDVNMQMVADGYAMADLYHPCDRQEAFLQTEIAARRNRAGFWDTLIYEMRCFERPIPQVDTANWRAYKNDSIGFEISYPPDWSITEDSDIVRVNPPDRSLLHLWRGPELRVRHDSAACYRPVGWWGEEYGGDMRGSVDTIRIGDLEFYSWSGSEGAAGTFYYEKGYTAARGNLCLTFAYVRSFGSRGEMQGPLPSEDRDSQMASLDQFYAVVSTLRFLK